jgi:hypothetical protein
MRIFDAEYAPRRRQLLSDSIITTTPKFSNRSKWLAHLVILFLVIGTQVRPASAECVNTAEPSCAVYSECFNQYCSCPNDDNYFMRYGAKYCSLFLGAAGLSPTGIQWRDHTLRCLEEKIIPKLPLEAPETCNCSEMKEFAFRTHVDCYTQPPFSICDLPLSDWKKIYSIISVKDLFDKDGAAQVLAVLQICVRKQPPPNATQLDMLNGMINILNPLAANTANTQSVFGCSCNNKTYTDEHSCISECKATLACFTGICYPLH